MTFHFFFGAFGLWFVKTISILTYCKRMRCWIYFPHVWWSVGRFPFCHILEFRRGPNHTNQTLLQMAVIQHDVHVYFIDGVWMNWSFIVVICALKTTQNCEFVTMKRTTNLEIVHSAFIAIQIHEFWEWKSSCFWRRCGSDARVGHSKKLTNIINILD